MSVSAHRFDNNLRYGAGDHPRQWQLTPSYVLDLVRQDLGGFIDLDPCTFADNPTEALSFYTVQDNGLAQSWWKSVYCNPPYAKAREPWVEKCIEHGQATTWPIILLIPAATDTRIFQKAASTASALVFVRGRVKFGTRRENRRQHAASHPSALIGWNTDLGACAMLGLRVVSNQDCVRDE